MTIDKITKEMRFIAIDLESVQKRMAVLKKSRTKLYSSKKITAKEVHDFIEELRKSKNAIDDFLAFP